MRRVALDLWVELAVRAFLILRRWNLELACTWTDLRDFLQEKAERNQLSLNSPL